MTMPHPMSEATDTAAQCWCDPRVLGRQMDPELAEVFAEMLDRKDAERAEGGQSIDIIVGGGITAPSEDMRDIETSVEGFQPTGETR